nr:MAG TPA: hypothetical protein [Microviridae sp.]
MQSAVPNPLQLLSVSTSKKTEFLRKKIYFFLN